MQSGQNVFDYLSETTQNKTLLTIADKVLSGKRIDFNEGVALFESASLGFAGTLADFIRRKKHGAITYFNRNFHIEQTTLCVFSCKFC
ncbi:MAG: aminofutalosine synthase MqnE, partial [Chitinophagales bacterium]